MGRFGPARQRLNVRNVRRISRSTEVIRVMSSTNFVNLILTIDYRALGLPDQIARARDMTPVMRQVLAVLQSDPDVYTRPDRYRGQWAVERGGFRINWKPGYPGYRSYTRVEATPGGALLESPRPYHPIPKKTASIEFGRMGAVFIVTGLIPL